MQELQAYTPEAPTAAVQICRQNSGEFEDVVSRYLPALYRRAYRFVGDPHDAEDAVQDALLSAYKHLDQFKGNAKMATWLTSIVTNSALTQLRRRPRQPNLSLDEALDEEQHYCASDRLAGTMPSPENKCIQSELLGHLMQFVAQLSPSLRKVIQLRHLDGFTTDEAAQTLGLAEGTVKAQVSRARSKLRQMARAV
jgi:RNA polymerase sigma-70 factor, ECF subfamily